MEKFTQEFCDKLTAKSRELEAVSSIEIVPVVAARSDHYFDFRVQVSLCAALCAALADVAWTGSWIEASLMASLAFAIVFALITLPPVLRFVLPSKLTHEAVIDEADATFLHEEVFATRARTGVLVFISLFERQVFVIGDKGLSSFVKPEYWAELGQKLAEDFKSCNPGQSFLVALDKLLTDVAPHFPATPDNPNELHDDLRKR
jgi:putative membrane protein